MCLDDILRYLALEYDGNRVIICDNVEQRDAFVRFFRDHGIECDQIFAGEMHLSKWMHPYVHLKGPGYDPVSPYDPTGFEISAYSKDADFMDLSDVELIPFSEFESRILGLKDWTAEVPEICGLFA